MQWELSKGLGKTICTYQPLWTRGIIEHAEFYVCFAVGDYDGYSGSGHGWETYSDDRSEHGDAGSRHSHSSGSSPEDGWYTYSKNTIWSDNDDEDFWITKYSTITLFNMTQVLKWKTYEHIGSRIPWTVAKCSLQLTIWCLRINKEVGIPHRSVHLQPSI